MQTPDQQSQAQQQQPSATAMLPPERAAAPPSSTTVENPRTKSTLDKVTSISKTLSGDLQQGLSYANARRARQQYQAPEQMAIPE